MPWSECCRCLHHKAFYPDLKAGFDDEQALMSRHACCWCWMNVYSLVLLTYFVDCFPFVHSSWRLPCEFEFFFFASSLTVSSVCWFVLVYLSNLFFSSRLFLSFSFFARCCSGRSQHWYCYHFCHWASRGPWGPPSGSPWLPQPWPCT